MTAPGMASIEVSVMRKVGPDGPEAGGKLAKVDVWKDTCEGVDQGDAIAAWLCAFLETVRACVRGGFAVARAKHGRFWMVYSSFDPSRDL